MQIIKEIVHNWTYKNHIYCVMDRYAIGLV